MHINEFATLPTLYEGHEVDLKYDGRIRVWYNRVRGVIDIEMLTDGRWEIVDFDPEPENEEPENETCTFCGCPGAVPIQWYSPNPEINGRRDYACRGYISPECKAERNRQPDFSYIQQGDEDEDA